MMLTYKHLNEVTNHLFILKYIVARALDDLEAVEERIEEENRRNLTKEEELFVVERLRIYADELKEHQFVSKAMELP